MTTKNSFFIHQIPSLFALTMVLAIVFWGCKKYTDPSPNPINNFTSHYCNNPKAVNYNWGFPGIEDNSICIFPADLFAGNYTYYDSILDVVNQIYIPYDTMDITINKLTDSTMTIVGQCAATQLTARATKNYRFSLDSTSDKGQTYCTINDTISGAGIKQQFNDTIFKYNYTISNNDIIQEHKGYLFKK
jgi:hypothetical protein